MNSGVYQIRNIVDNKVYVGQAINFNIRWSEHKTDLKKNRHHSRYLQNAYNKYGKENFEFEILEYCEPDRNVLTPIEQKYIDLKSEYNMSKIASCPGAHEVSEETKKKISKANLGKKRTEEEKKLMSIARKGRKLSEETKKKMSLFQAGRKQSELQIKNRSLALRKPVFQIQKESNKTINEFTSIKEASIITKISTQNISAVATGRRKSTGGYIWKFKNETQCP